MTGSEDRALTVVLATCNRSAVLAETLAHMCRTDRTALTIDFVVVDNNSQDDTRSVVESFQARLPIQYLHEPRTGKNRALNRALEQGRFGQLVVFTDDDVTPAPDWFRAIVEISARWPHHKVFGGRIVPAWPVKDPPGWAHDSLIRQLAFAAHDLGPVEKPYVATEQPFGPNFWLRRDVLEHDLRFDESVGPGTGSLGDEVMFLHALQRKGLEIIYSPHACVEHRIQPDGICERKLEQRALMVGRIGPTMYGLCRPDLLDSAPWLWKLLRHIRLNQAKLSLLRAKFHPSAQQRVIRSISPLINIGYNAESLRLARHHRDRRIPRAS